MNVGVYQTRIDGIDANALGADLFGEADRERVERALGRGVGDQEPTAAEARTESSR